MRVLAVLLLATLSCVCADQTFRITGSNGNQGFYFNLTNLGLGEEVQSPNLNVTVGETITFRIEAAITDDNGPLYFGLSNSYQGGVDDFTSAAKGSLTPSASCNKSTNAFGYYTTNTSTPCILTWMVYQPAQDEKLYYTGRALAMFGVINVIGSGTTTTTVPPTNPSGTTTSPPTTPGSTTTAPPTSTGNNSATNIVPGAIAAIIAAINTLFA